MPSFRFPWVLAALACAVMVFAVPMPASADLIASAPQGIAAPAPAGVVVAAPAADRDVVLGQLQATGMSAEEAAQRLQEMTQQDVEVLASSPDQMQVAGAGMTIAPLLIILVIAGIAMLYLLITNQI